MFSYHATTEHQQIFSHVMTGLTNNTLNLSDGIGIRMARRENKLREIERIKMTRRENKNYKEREYVERNREREIQRKVK